MRRFLICFLYIQICLTGSTQFPDLIFKHINRASGLPVDGITCLAQDSTGYIWIGSKEGLFRYDGFNFKSFYYTPESNKSIPSNYISKIHIDKKNLVWVATSGGCVILKNTGEVLQIFNAGTSSLFSKESERIIDIREINDVYWITTSEGLFSARRENNDSFNIQKHDFKKQFGATNQLGSFTVDQQGRFWICTIQGLVIYDPAKNILLHTDNNPSKLEILNEHYPFKGVYIDHHQKP